MFHFTSVALTFHITQLYCGPCRHLASKGCLSRGLTLRNQPLPVSVPITK